MACADGGAAHKIRLELTTAAEIFLIAPNAHHIPLLANNLPLTDTGVFPRICPDCGSIECNSNGSKTSKSIDSSLQEIRSEPMAIDTVPGATRPMSHTIRSRARILAGTNFPVILQPIP